MNIYRKTKISIAQQGKFTMTGIQPKKNGRRVKKENIIYNEEIDQSLDINPE